MENVAACFMGSSHLPVSKLKVRKGSTGCARANAPCLNFHKSAAGENTRDSPLIQFPEPPCFDGMAALHHASWRHISSFPHAQCRASWPHAQHVVVLQKILAKKEACETSRESFWEAKPRADGGNFPGNREANDIH